MTDPIRQLRLMAWVESLLVRYDARGKFRGDRNLPVLLLTGPPGAGKTAAVDELKRQYSGEIPVATYPFDSHRSASLREVLSSVAYNLQQHCSHYGSISFRRLAIAERATRQNAGAGIAVADINGDGFADVVVFMVDDGVALPVAGTDVRLPPGTAHAEISYADSR